MKELKPLEFMFGRLVLIECACSLMCTLNRVCMVFVWCVFYKFYFIVTGPYRINRVPLRRVDQTYVIATRTKVDIGAINLPDTLNDDYFKRKSVEAKGKSTSIFQEGDTVSTTVASTLLLANLLSFKPLDSAYTRTC